MRAVALIDGDHAPAVVRDALARLPYEVVGVILAGGGEKLRPGEGYGVPLLEGFGEAELVLDLADEPVMTPEARASWAARALAAGLPYQGPDFRFDPPRLEPLDVPSLAIIGTGKRVGKTALAVHLARLLGGGCSLAVVCMGRGGPTEPCLRERPPTLEELRALSRAGAHAASDYLEVSLLAGVPTVGCARVGGGLLGAVASTNVVEAARLACARRPDLLLVDASGAAVPPLAVDRRILVAGPGHELDSGFGLYRRALADLVVAVGCERPGALTARLRLAPQGALEGRVAVFSAGASDVSHLEADVVHVSTSLGDRAALAAELARLDADTYLTELKGAAIELVAEDAFARGRALVFAGNEVVADGLDEALRELVPADALAA